jgi:Ca-activated chloride channel family protein
MSSSTSTNVVPRWQAVLRKIITWTYFSFVALAMLIGCTGGFDNESPFRILSGSENQALESVIDDFADQQELKVEIDYAGSVEIMQEAAKGTESTYDAVWPANSMWILLGDTTNTIQLSKSIMRSPVVLGVKKPLAERLGWVGAEVTVEQMLAAAESGQLTFMMANATQSDSGASAYLGFLYAFAGQPSVLTSTDLQSQDVRERIERILNTVSRTAGDSGFLKDLFLAEYDSYDAMVNYESAIIETNQTLISQGKDPLYAVYLRDGTSIGDFPFGYVDKGDAKKQAVFEKIQAYLLSPDIQRQLLSLGRRTGFGPNPDPSLVDPAVFNPDWGIDVERVLTQIAIPDASVVMEALRLYQSTFRKPSVTVFALDFSGSMEASGGDKELKEAMRLLMDQEVAARYFLEAGPDDVIVIIPFSDRILGVWTVTGNDPAQFGEFSEQIDQLEATGGTDMYSAIIEGIPYTDIAGGASYFKSIVVMTDGQSRDGLNFQDFKDYVASNSRSVPPIYGITFGDVDDDQLQELAEFSSGAVFDGSDDLAGAFRAVKGYT